MESLLARLVAAQVAKNEEVEIPVIGEEVDQWDLLYLLCKLAQPLCKQLDIIERSHPVTKQSHPDVFLLEWSD